MKLPLFVLVGPTAVGKTAISVAVARAVGGEIISGDSMQVYRGMAIGTAKITRAEMRGVPHHMIDIRDPDQDFSVAEFQKRVDELVEQIHARGRLPMLVGGTGLYVRSVILPYSFTEQETDQALRSALAQEEELHGPGHLHRRLTLVDPVAAKRLHPNDLRRISRALEVYELTGEPISVSQTAHEEEPRYDDLLVGLTMDREALYRRIDHRVDQMLKSGWLMETQQLLERYGPNVSAMQALGYRELVLHLRGLLTQTEAVALVKRNTRRFAKRQFTWFRREERMNWLDLSDEQSRSSAVNRIVRLAEGKWSQGVEPERT